MSFQDVFRKSFLEGYASLDIQIGEILLCMVCTLLLSIYIFHVYKMLNKNSFYNKNFNLSLIALALITAAVILTIQSNIVVSLGMVGALSIVRFRTAVKEPLDLVFLFWSISVGIICGAGFAMIALICSVLLTLTVLLFSRYSGGKTSLMLVVNAKDYRSEEGIMEIVEKNCHYYKTKARNMTKDHLDMVIEVRVKEEKVLIQELMALDSLVSFSLVAHDGDVTL